jgi:allophanate hydrolase
MIHVLEGGLLTTVQDAGRFGYYSQGVAPAGAADSFSFTVANWLVGNEANAAALEVMLRGPRLAFEEETVIAVTGAPCRPHLNTEEIPMWEAIAVRKGDVLSFKHTRGGVHAYIAVAGQIEVPPDLDSRSTYLASRIGGFGGRALRNGDRLPVGSLPSILNRRGKAVPESLRPVFAPSFDIHFIMGIRSDKLSDEGLKQFLNTEWRISTESNRTGYRFKDGRIPFAPGDPPFGAGNNPSNVVDYIYPVGSILIPNEQEIIVLLNDTPTGGGYVSVGTVIRQDLGRIAQSMPNATVRFVAVTLEQALELRKQYRHTLLQIKDSLLS